MNAVLVTRPPVCLWTAVLAGLVLLPATATARGPAAGRHAAAGTTPALPPPHLSAKRKAAVAARAKPNRPLLSVARASATTTTLTADPATSTTVVRNGHIFHVTGGTTTATSQVQSLTDLSLSAGDTAQFQTAASTQNLVVRVTGGRAAAIDGTIQTRLTDGTSPSSATLFLLDPAGVMFTTNASLDVGGSLVASTADSVRLSDGATVASGSSAAPTMGTGGAPVFTFIAAAPAGVSVIGATLHISGGEVLSVIGGPVSLDTANVTAAGGRVNIMSVGGAGAVSLDPASLTVDTDISAAPTLGDLNFTKSVVTLDGPAGGRISVRGNTLELTSSTLTAQTVGAGGGLGIDVAVSQALTASGSSVGTGTSAAGAAGPVTVSAGELKLLNGGNITSDTYGTGAAGDVSVTVRGHAVIDGGTTDAFTGVSAETVSPSAGAGRGGDVTVSAGSMMMINSAGIETATSGPGAAGKTAVSVSGALLLDDTASSTGFTSIYSDSGQDGAGVSGAAGQVTVSAGTLKVLDDAQITSNTYGTGMAGNVIVTVAGRLTVAGNADYNSLISAEDYLTTPGGSRGGSVTVTAGGSILLKNGGVISASTRASDQLASDLTIHTARKLVLAEGSIVALINVFTYGGDLAITARTAILNASQVENFEAGLAPTKFNVAALFVSTDSAAITAQSTGNTIVADLAKLTSTFTNVSSQLADQCSSVTYDGAQQISSFVVTGLGGTPIIPGGWVPTPIDDPDGTADTPPPATNRR